MEDDKFVDLDDYSCVVMLKNSEEKLVQLYERKKYINSKIKDYKMKLDALYSLLEIVNEDICKVQGHSFTMWEENADRFLDRSWYYERQCSICGKKEIITEEPDNYVWKDESGKVYRKK